MARITYDPTTPGGLMVAEAVQHVVEAKTLFTRAKALLDAISNNGVESALFEGSAEFGIAAGDGTTFYDTISQTKTALVAVSDASLASIDMGG